MKNLKLKKLIILLSVVFILLCSSRSGYAGYFSDNYGDPVSQTFEFMMLAGYDFTIDGSPAQVGDEIALFIPEVSTPIGLFIVDTPGIYGTMTIYGSYGSSPGASPGQELTDFRVYDVSTSTLITDVQPVIPAGCVDIFCPPDSLPLVYQTDKLNGTLLDMQATSPPSAAPEPVSSILFMSGGVPFVLRRYWKKRGAA
jgi:hypothetical protein